MVDTRAQPVPTALTQPYWTAASHGQLAVQRCVDCGRFRHLPTERCRFCRGERYVFEPVSGRGRVHTFSVVHRTFAPGFAARVPYVIAWIELDEQADLRVFGNVLDIAPDEVRIGLRVTLMFDHIDGFGPVPAFRPADEEQVCASG